MLNVNLEVQLSLVLEEQECDAVGVGKLHCFNLAGFGECLLFEVTFEEACFFRLHSFGFVSKAVDEKEYPIA